MIKLKCNACDGCADDEVDIRFGRTCDNHCNFCIERRCGKPVDEFNLQKMIETTKSLGHRKAINIVGGEPLLNFRLQDLYDYLVAVKDCADEFYIITSLPLITNYGLFNKIVNLVDGIIVSVQHYDSDKNNEIFNASIKYDRIEALKILAETYPGKISVTINISNSGINSEESLISALKLFEEMKLPYVRINELGDWEEWISIKKLLPKLRVKSPFAYGCSIDITKFIKRHYKINIPVIKCRIRCHRLEPRAEISFADFIKMYLKEKRFMYEQKNNIKIHKYERNTQTVVYEDGTTDLYWATYNQK